MPQASPAPEARENLRLGVLFTTLAFASLLGGVVAVTGGKGAPHDRAFR